MGKSPPMTISAISDEQHVILLTLIDAERARLASQWSAMILTYDELVAAADLEPPDDEHDPDGTTAYERAQVASLAEALEQRIAALDEAAVGLVDGTYGWC